MNADGDTILEAVTTHYLKSGDFNGTPMREIDADDAARKLVVSELVAAGRLTLEFGDRHPNPYIRALPVAPVERQLQQLQEATDLTHVCMYPSLKHLSGVVNSKDYDGVPYTMRLALGEPQLAFLPFDLRVLETYRNDPRYGYETDDIQGSIHVRDAYYQSEQMAERDQVLLQQFGFGYDEGLSNRCVMVLLYDLHGLSPEHQQLWKTNELAGSFKPHPDFAASVMGEWPNRVSLFQAFTGELEVINGMSELMGRPPLFRKTFNGEERPRKFGFLLRPTLGELNEFVHLLDKMLSDNIDLAFFLGEVEVEYLEERKDGVKVARQKGSLTVLNEWIDKTVRFNDATPKEEAIATLKKVRKMRQQPAHAVREDEFNQKYQVQQRELMIEAYNAVRTLRLMFANHPKARQYDVPEWLYKGDIWTK